MAEEKVHTKELPAEVRLQVPSLILPSPNQSITVLSPAQQQQLGLDITQLISGQQLHLLASHLSGGNETSQPVIIVPKAVDNQVETSLPPKLEVKNMSTEIAKSCNKLPENAPEKESQTLINQIPSTSTTPSRRGRPNKFVALETGDIIRQKRAKPLQTKTTTPKTRGRPKKPPENVAKEDKNTDISNETPDENVTSNKRNSKRSKRLRISESESDCADEVKNSEATDNNTDLSRLAQHALPSQRSQRLRRSVGKSPKYADYEVEDVIQRPENVWITEKNVVVAETVDPLTSSVNMTGENSKSKATIKKIASNNLPPAVPKTKRGRKKRQKQQVDVDNDEDNDDAGVVNCNEEESQIVVTCGACNTSMPRKTYEQHKFEKHNGLTWIDGENRPIDFRDTTIENQNYLSNLIREAFAKKGAPKNGGFKNSGKYLPCEKCEHHAYSAAGYLSHFRFCQVSEEEKMLRMWKCPLCCRVMMPSSRYAHETTHKSKDNNAMKDAEQDALNSLMAGDSKRMPRRQAAVKAEGYIQEVLEKNNTDLGGPSDPLKLGFRKPKESTKGIGAVKQAWSRQLEVDGIATCRNLGCNYSSTDLNELQQHHEECTLKPAKVYECLRCTIHCSSEAEVISHITEKHPNASTLSDPDHNNSQSEDLSDFEDASSGEEAAKQQPKKNQLRPMKGSPEKVLPERGGCILGMGYSLRCMMPYWTFRNKVPYRPVLKWMLDFCTRNHSEILLFPKLMKFIKLKLLEQPHLYKPSTQSSVSFCTSETSHPTINSNFISQSSWTSIPAFTGISDAGVPIFFTGGPVSALAWCPTPVSLREEQILAVSTLHSMDSVPKVNDTTGDHGLIQIWNLGTITNTESFTKLPTLVMGLGHKWGTIRQLAWCPSGCWLQDHYGLLAAACSDGSVRLIPVPRSDQVQSFFEAQATLTLLPHSLQDRRSSCLRISWYPGKGHGYIAAGFGDGLVCLWRLKNSSQLLTNVDGNNEHGDELHPYLKFHAHTGPVTALELSSIGEGQPRYVFTGGISEKNMTYWDLEKLGEVTLGNFNRRARVTDSTWMTLWPLATSSFEDLQSGTTFIPPRNFCRHFMILPQNSGALSVEKGDWLNGIAQSTVAGEISLTLVNQIIFGMDNEKLQREKRALLTRTCVANLKSEEGEDEKKDLSFLTYEEAGRQGLVFCDIALDTDNVWCKDSKCAQLPETMDPSPSVNYPITAINHIAWNPNASSFSWIAAGYQCGLVRLLQVKCKSSEQIIKSSILKHSNEDNS